MAGGGGGSGGKGGDAGSGLTAFDLNAIMSTLANTQEAMSNRYAQLGLGVPGGNPLTAAQTGTSLHAVGPSTMEQQDLNALSNQGNAIAGQLQTANLNNPALNPDASAGYSAGFGGLNQNIANLGNVGNTLGG